MTRPSRFIPIPVGSIFDYLEVIGPSIIRGPRQRNYIPCRCRCGRTREIRLDALKGGHSVSCGFAGCRRSDISAKLRTKHGLSRVAEYKIWVEMHRRCNNPKAANYQNYGGRGIQICGRWSIYENFLADVGHRPSREYSLDRVDNSLGYEPGNVKWATAIEQSANTRITVRVTIADKAVSLNNAWKLLGLGSQSAIYCRIKKLGETPQQACDYFAARQAAE